MVGPEACSCVCFGQSECAWVWLDYLVCMIAPPSSAKLAPHIKVAITDGHLLRLLCYL